MTIIALPKQFQTDPLQCFDDRLRLLLPVLLALTGLSCQSWSVLLGLFSLALAILLLASAGSQTLLKRALMIEGFVFLLAVMLPFTWPGTADYHWLGIGISHEGVEEAGRIMLRSSISMLGLLGFTHGIDSSRLGDAMQRLGVSLRLVTLLLLTIRYLTLLQHELERLHKQLKLRGFRARFNFYTWRTYGYLFGALLLRALDRAERVGKAMRCRGFDGCFPAADPLPFLAGRQLLYLLLSLICATGLLIWEKI